MAMSLVEPVVVGVTRDPCRTAAEGVHRSCGAPGCVLEVTGAVEVGWRLRMDHCMPAVLRAQPTGSAATLRSGWWAQRGWLAQAGWIRGLGLSRQEALAQAPGGGAVALDPTALVDLFQALRSSALPLHIEVLRGRERLRLSGSVRGVSVCAGQGRAWGNGWQLRWQEEQLALAWVVRSAAEEGLTSCIELFDQAGDCVALLSATPLEPGRPDPCAWASLLDLLIDEARPGPSTAVEVG